MSGTMALYKRGKFWWYRFQFAGKPYEASTRTRNQAAAAKIEAKFRTDLALGVYGLQPMKPGSTFRDYAKQFLEWTQDHTKSQATKTFYAEKMARLLKFEPLAKCRLNFIDEVLIESYIKHRRKTVAINTLNLELATLRRALRVARKKLKVMTAAPDVTLLPGGNKRTFVLTWAQEAAYLAACPQPLKDAATLMLDTGLRVGECVKVRWADFSADRTRLNATDTERFDPRILGVSARCLEMLERRRLFFPDEPYLFRGKKKGSHIRVNSLDDEHRRVREETRLEDGSEFSEEFVIHSLRHTFATRLGEVEPNAFMVKDALGHADISTSQLYVHTQTAAVLRAFRELDMFNRIMRGEGGDKIGDSRLPVNVSD